MNVTAKFFTIPFFMIIGFGNNYSQSIELLGLENKFITSMKIGYGLIAVGTNSNGVYWQNLYNISDSNWIEIALSDVNVRSVYPHKSGPLGWAIGIGAAPSAQDSEFVYCSYLGEQPKSMSYGIDKSLTSEIHGIDGFPDPTICGETFALGGSKLYRRFFADTTWHQVYQSIQGRFRSLKARERFQYVYAGGSEGFTGILLIRSSDKGDSWEHLNPGIPVEDLDFWGDDLHKVIIADRFSMRISINDGLDWNEVFTTDSLFIQSITFSKKGTRIVLAANTIYYDLPRSYLFLSIDDGNNWEQITLPIFDLIVGMEIEDESIFLATIMSGIYKVKLSEVKIKNPGKNIRINDYLLYQNYPNPFNPSTTLKYEIPREGNVTPKVFDVLGREIRTLINKEQPQGNYSIDFNASSLTSGIYFYRIQAGQFVKCKKMILLR